MAEADFEALWADARRLYAESASQSDLKDAITPQTVDDLLDKIRVQNFEYEYFRKKQGTLYKALRAVMKPIELIGPIAAGGVSNVFPASSAAFGAVMFLVDAAKGVSASLDAIEDLLGQLGDLTARLEVHLKVELSLRLRGQLAKILVCVIEVFTRSTKVIKESFRGRLKLFGKNLLDNDHQLKELVARLDKLTRSEALLVGAETLVETKRITRAVDTTQTSMSENTAQLSQLALSTHQVSTGVGQILDALTDASTRGRVERDTRYMEAVERLLHHSNLAQDKYDEIKRENVSGSGDWIRTEAQLQAWVAGNISLLWIEGNPGSGKSFLTYNIITYLHELHQDVSGHAGHASVGYFFFRDNQDQTRLVDHALRDIAYQIAQNDQAYAKYVASIPQSRSDVASTRSAWQRLFVDFFISDEAIESSAFILFDGIDESFQDGREILFELLNDIRNTKGKCRLRVALLGRPQIYEEIAGIVGGNVPTVLVDSTKNGGDIAHYVDLSIQNSRVLNRVSNSLKELIIQTLRSKAGGMFMWVKLMIAELGKKSRESAIKDALKAAPKGLTEMLRHVLEGYSATLTEEDAGDLNDMLAWVTLAKRPLALGEVDAMLRLKSLEGEGVIYLEGKLRKQFASFFTLTREDNLTTADLLGPRKAIIDDEDEDASTGAEPNEGLEDVENETDFESNPNTTTVSFSHASISDFFRVVDQGKVQAHGGDFPHIGVSLKEAQVKVAKTCIGLFVDKALWEKAEQDVNLREYSTQFWKEHLDDVDRASISTKDKIKIANIMARMVRDEEIMPDWNAEWTVHTYTTECARSMLSWITDDDVFHQFEEDAAAYFDSLRSNPIVLFEPVMMLLSRGWLLPNEAELNSSGCLQMVAGYNIRKAGGVVRDASDFWPDFSAKAVRDTAEWAALDKTAEWHRRVGSALLKLDFHDDALAEFREALKLDPSSWRAKKGIADVYNKQTKYTEAIDMTNEVLQLLEDDEEALHGDFREAHMRNGDSYEELAEAIGDDGDLTEKAKLFEFALESFEKAFSHNKYDFECVRRAIHVLHKLAQLEHSVSPSPGTQSEERTDLGVPNGIQLECYEKIMKLLHMLNDIEGDTYKTFFRFLDLHGYPSVEVFQIIATAAQELQQLEWLQGRIRQAILAARKELEVVTAADLALCLAALYGTYGDDEERALRIWEALGSEPVTSAALASSMGQSRTYALNEFGRCCLRRALEDETNAETYMRKLERITAKRGYGARMGTEDSVPPNDVGCYLAAMYHKIGRYNMAVEAVRPHLKDAMIILSDDDPSNDFDCFYDLSKALLSIGDEANAIAIRLAYRRYREGIAVVDTSQSTEPTDVGRGGYVCDGPCRRLFKCCDGMKWCRFCTYDFCQDCHKLLVDGDMPLKICGKSHSFVTIPRLTAEQVFKKGELFVEGKAVPVELWKDDLKKKYGL